MPDISTYEDTKGSSENYLEKYNELLIPTDKKNITLPVLWKNQIQKFKVYENELLTTELIDIATPGIYRRIGAFVIDPLLSATSDKWVMKFYASEFQQDGDLGDIKSFPVNQEEISYYENELDRKALWSFLGMSSHSNNRTSNYDPKKEFVYLQSNIMDSILSELSSAKKLMFLTVHNQLIQLNFESNPFHLKLSLNEVPGGFLLKANLTNEIKTFSVNADSFFYLAPYCLVETNLVCTDFEMHEEWLGIFKDTPELSVPTEDIDGFLTFYFNYQNAPVLNYPDTLQIKYKNKFSKVRLVIDVDDETQVEDSSQNSSGVDLIVGTGAKSLIGRLQFLYGEEYVDYKDLRTQVFSSETRTVFTRNTKNEIIEDSKFHEYSDNTESLSTDPYKFVESNLEQIVEKAFSLGWDVVAFKKTINHSKDFKTTISSGIDWFDLSVKFEFNNGFIFGLPQLLQTIKSGQRFVSLADGTTGLIPKEWIKKFKNIIQAGSIEGDSIRLSKIQTLFYASEFCEDKNFTSDRKFKTLLRIVEDINNISEVQLDPRFKGKLRKYQKIGVSWLSLMSNHEIGAVLADDMGLGKTVQVLAAISKIKKSQSLIVAPKSLVFNWISEAKKFTPHLKFHDHTGTDRMERLQNFEKANVAITTYQTFRQDIEFFKEKKFEYFILDEAHYIKNSESQAYMACKLINARKKIALTGTPVENSLKDLFSILSIVNPGLISNALADKYANEMDPEAIGLLSKSLRPFILRRTKDKVLKDLPKKIEQVLYSELSPSERKKYDELKNYYWNNLNDKIGEKGFQRSKIEILEAILRLRQASCHPGLLNKHLVSGSSAKFDLMLDQLETVLNDGHKALIFSQFTSLLGLFGKALAKRKIKYEYLDGKTNNRAERVRNFQENEKIQLFLISLKAGGVGLNLTSADYVFILDPWWNPAAESQAIDRAHRYGQTKKVFAYKVIAKDTIEEKILALQEKKRALANAMISSEKSLIKGMKMEDLRELFS
ncbi:MAG: SNF2-related protein [Bacteriovorax sp.]|nr:SNF2-related protein [Bacteriovorax sp.]